MIDDFLYFNDKIIRLTTMILFIIVDYNYFNIKIFNNLVWYLLDLIINITNRISYFISTRPINHHQLIDIKHKHHSIHIHLTLNININKYLTLIVKTNIHHLYWIKHTLHKIYLDLKMLIRAIIYIIFN